MDYEKLFKRIGVAAIILLFFGLGGWYLFLRGQSSDLEQLRNERGFDVGIPSFTGSRGSTFSNIESGQSPTGESVDFSLTEGGSDASSNETSETPRPPRLWRTSAIPVAGAAFVEVASSTKLRYVERSTGHVFDVDIVTGKTERRTNTLRPQIYRSFMTEKGVLQQSVEQGQVVTFAGEIGARGDDGFSTFNGKTLPPNILAISPAPDSKNITYIVRGATNASVVRAAFDGSKPTQLASVGTGSWNLFSLANSTVIAEKAASGILGSAYTIVNGLLNPLVRSVPGLTIAPHPEGEALLYSSDTGSDVQLYLKPSPTASPAGLQIRTVAEKCAWSTGRSLVAYCGVPRSMPRMFLNLWYRGLSHTEDTIWKVEGGGGTATEIFTPQPGVAMDVERPMVDDTGNYLAFINGIDKSLWVIRLKE